ncbi:MAG: MBL fold metallo-hydrolase [Verrucomicrobiota bacterium]
MLNFTILGSGSRGNCAYLETEHARVLVDAGFSCRQIEERLATLGRELRDVQAVFLTHEHGDHVLGLKTMAKRYGIPVYANRPTAECLRDKLPEFQGWRLFDTGATIRHADLEVDSFAVPHDAYDPVGFIFRHRLGSVGFLTDLGYATKLVVERVRASRALVLEANHCPDLLARDRKRPWSVKQRILSRHGHLSNEAAAQVAQQVAGPDLEDIFLGHLSPDCNTPELARETVAAGLADGHAGIRLHGTSMERPAATLGWS